jgi:hypothetical protein
MPISIHLSSSPSAALSSFLGAQNFTLDTDDAPHLIWLDPETRSIHLGTDHDELWHLYLPVMRRDGTFYRETNGSIRYTYVSEEDAKKRVLEKVHQNTTRRLTDIPAHRTVSRPITVDRHDGTKIVISRWTSALHRKIAALVAPTPYLYIDAAVSTLLTMLATEADDAAEGSEPTGQLYRSVTRAFGEVWFELDPDGTHVAMLPDDH